MTTTREILANTCITGTLTAAGVSTLGATTPATVSADGVVTVANTTTSTTKDTGALIVEGGVGIEDNLNIGGDLAVSGGIIGLPYAQFEMSLGSQVITASTKTTIVWNGFSTSGTNPPDHNSLDGKIEINRTGTYVIAYSVEFDIASAPNEVEIWMEKNSSGRYAEERGEVSNSQTKVRSGSAILQLLDTDDVELRIYISSSAGEISSSLPSYFHLTMIGNNL